MKNQEKDRSKDTGRQGINFCKAGRRCWAFLLAAALLAELIAAPVQPVGMVRAAGDIRTRYSESRQTNTKSARLDESRQTNTKSARLDESRQTNTKSVRLDESRQTNTKSARLDESRQTNTKSARLDESSQTRMKSAWYDSDRQMDIEWWNGDSWWDTPTIAPTIPVNSPNAPMASAKTSNAPVASAKASYVPTSSAITSAPPTASAIASGTPRPRVIATPKPKADILLGKGESDVSIIIGQKGEFDIDRSVSDAFSASMLSRLAKVEYYVNDNDNSDVLRLTRDGHFEALKVGRVTIYVSGYGYGTGSYYSGFYDDDDDDDYYDYDDDDNRLFRYSYTIYVIPDMSKVTLEKNALTLYHVKYGYYSDESGGSIKILSDYVFKDGDDYPMQVTSSNKSMRVYAEISNNVLTLSCGKAGHTTVTLTLCEKEFQIELTVISLTFSETSVVLAKHHSKTLKLKGYQGTLHWKSSRPAVASVSAKGRVRAKRKGNAVVSAMIGETKIGCIVSVIPKGKVKAIKRAQYIAKTSKYSQPKRMQKGYYDCSSLVWRSYSPYGYKFGASYAPTAAGEATYLAQHHKIKGKYSRKNVENLKFLPGDLLFETGAKNGRYKGIYHVEMMAGYEFCGWRSNGKPAVLMKWANRPDGYYGYGAGIVGRP